MTTGSAAGRLARTLTVAGWKSCLSRYPPGGVAQTVRAGRHRQHRPFHPTVRLGSHARSAVRPWERTTGATPAVLIGATSAGARTGGPERPTTGQRASGSAVRRFGDSGRLWRLATSSTREGMAAARNENVVRLARSFENTPESAAGCPACPCLAGAFDAMFRPSSPRRPAAAEPGQAAAKRHATGGGTPLPRPARRRRRSATASWERHSRAMPG